MPFQAACAAKRAAAAEPDSFKNRSCGIRLCAIRLRGVVGRDFRNALAVLERRQRPLRAWEEFPEERSSRVGMLELARNSAFAIPREPFLMRPGRPASGTLPASATRRIPDRVPATRVQAS